MAYHGNAAALTVSAAPVRTSTAELRQMGELSHKEGEAVKRQKQSGRLATGNFLVPSRR